jgi:hypothetical protein
MAIAGVASGAASFSDRAGDHNPAPDVTSVTLAERVAGVIELRVAVANFPTLPSDSWFNVWLDLDSDPTTGSLGDEALVRYRADGSIQFYLWNGARLVERDAPGFVGSYQDGVLTLTMPTSELDDAATFGVLVVGARSQNLSLTTEFISSDFAPDTGRSAWAAPAEATFPDPAADQDAAPDITSVRVSDAKDGWIRFAISTPNYPVLPSRAVLAVNIDSDNRPATGQGGVDAMVSMGGGQVLLRRWSAAERDWVNDTKPTRVRGRSSGGVVTIDVHRSELADSPRFGFTIAAVDINLEAEMIVAADIAPESGRYWRYTLANAPALRLLLGEVTATPARPRAGKPFTITMGVTRSDTQRSIASGTVKCDVFSGGKRVRAAGRVRAGAGHCTLVVPEGATALSGSMTVRSGGTSVSARFRFPVR